MRQLPIKLNKLSSKQYTLKPLLILLLLPLLTIHTSWAQQLAFPTAEGYGRFVSGGRGGKVIYVTNLNDSGSGSFRAALLASGPRTVVFNVSGTITLQSPISVKNGNLTIAGQTSPNGITIRRSPVYIQASNVIIRYMRFRLGGEAGKSGYDALSITGQSGDISGVIVDHCSVSWARDECVSIIGDPQASPSASGPGISNITLQWSFVSEGLSSHAFGGFIKYHASNISIIKNLFAHNTQRNPNINGANGSVTNNVIYNWGGRGVTLDNVAKLNVIGNYAKAGADSKSIQGYMVIGGQGGTPVDNQLYVKGNYHSKRRTNVNDNNEWAVFDTDASESKYRKSNPHNFNEGIKVLSASEAFDNVLADGGASIFRDAVDERIVKDTKNGTGRNNISSPLAVGGWPSIAMGTPYPDKDKDGMDDNWEKAVGLNANDDSDRNGDRDGDGYTNLEEFLNCSILGNCESSAPVNTAPTISDISDQQIDENTTLGPLNFTIGDSETNADDLTVTATSGNQTLVANNSIVLGGKGVTRNVTITPSGDQIGTAQITVTVSDGDKKTSESFNVTVKEVVSVNTPPTITNISDQTIDENTSTKALSFTIGDAETDADDLTLTATSGNQALVTNGGISLGGSSKTRTVTVTPAKDQTGTAKITVTISDGDKKTSESFTVTVKEVVSVNTPPTISSISNQTIDENTSTKAIAFTIGDAETSADNLTVTATSDNQALVTGSGITLGGTGKNRTIAVSPVKDQTGTAKITVTVSDGDKKTAGSFTLTVKEVVSVNTPPTITSVANQTIDENTSTQAIAFTIGDAETNADNLTVTATSGNQALVANINMLLGGSGTKRTIIVSPKKDQTGTAIITVTVSDGDKKTAKSFALTVKKVIDSNTPPTVSDISNQTIDENTSMNALPFTIGDMETSANELVVTAACGDRTLVDDADISFAGKGAKRSITVVPKHDKTGTAKITVTVSDGEKKTAESFILTVQKPIDDNTPPTISNIKSQSIDENGSTGSLPFSIGDAESDVNDLTVNATSSNQELVGNDNIELNGSGANRKILINPKPDQTGITTITIVVSDGDKQTTESFRVTVNTVINENTAPVISHIGNQVTSMNQKIGPVYFKISDKETPAGDLKLRVQTSNREIVANDRIFISGEGENRKLVMYPTKNAVGTCYIRIKVSDGSKTTTKSVRVDVSSMTGVPDILKSKMKIYPNPFNNYIKINTKKIRRGVELAIYDSRGRLRKRARMPKTRAGWSSLELNLSFLESGLYYMKIRYDGVRATSMLVKKSY